MVLRGRATPIRLRCAPQATAAHGTDHSQTRLRGRLESGEGAVARRRGFFAEMQHQARVAEQRSRANAREQQAAARRAEQAQRAAQRAQAAAERADEADRKRLEREAAAAHVAAQQAEVDVLNSELAGHYAELAGLLTATLEVDDFVDLEALRAVVKHPPFDREDLRKPTQEPVPIPDPARPVRGEAQPPSGLFGRKKKLAEAQAAVEAQYAADHARWQEQTEALPAQRAAQAERYATAEKVREEQLAKELARYESESAEREREAQEQNAALDELIAGLGYGTGEAVQEYVGIVLANSVYPDSFPVAHTSEFDPSTAELRLHVVIPGPDQVPTIKTYKYTRSTDAITSTSSSQKDIKDRYAAIVHAVALRSLHEVFEADRRGLVRSISLELGTNTINPATGREMYVPFVAVATDREVFEHLDLSAVMPAATLEHLGAAVSKNPHGLVHANGTGVRRT